MSFLKNPLASGVVGSQLLKDKKKTAPGSLVNTYGQGGQRTGSMIGGASSKPSLY